MSGRELLHFTTKLSCKSEYTPRLIKTFEGTEIIKIAAGLLHTACIDENGAVFIFGERTTKGFGGAKNATTPLIVCDLPISQEIACGGYHTCVVTNGGELYSWGSNENGCLGLGGTTAIREPTKVEGPLLKFQVYEVSCGWKHTAAISGEQVFTWGWGGSNGTFSIDGHSSGGQLDVGMKQQNHLGYFELNIDQMTGGNTKVQEIAREAFLSFQITHGTAGTGFHELCYRRKVKYYGSFLSPKGHGDDVDYFEPTKVSLGENLRPLQVSCGFNHTGAIFEYSES